MSHQTPEAMLIEQGAPKRAGAPYTGRTFVSPEKPIKKKLAVFPTKPKESESLGIKSEY